MEFVYNGSSGEICVVPKMSGDKNEIEKFISATGHGNAVSMYMLHRTREMRIKAKLGSSMLTFAITSASSRSQWQDIINIQGMVIQTVEAQLIEKDAFVAVDGTEYKEVLVFKHSLPVPSRK